MSSDMLREVSESLFEYLIEAFPTEKSYTRNDIEQDPMPPLLAHFLGQTLQHRLDVEVEHLRTVRSTWFDYEHPDVQHAYKSFVAALAQYSHIPAEEWRSTLKRATKLVIAHLILPTHTLVEFVFREEDGPLAAPVIYREISYFAAYPYLREAVETFLKKRQLKEIDRTRFSSLLTQVDRHMTANYSVDQWMRMLRPLFDLMRRVPETRNQGVPIDMLAMFFGDKEAYEIQGRLQVEKEVHRIATIDENGLRRVIDGSVGPFEQELQATPPPVQSMPSNTAMPPSNPVSAPAAASTPSYLPAEEAPPAPPVEEKPVPKEDDAQKPLWERFQKSTGTDKEKAVSPAASAEKKEAEDAVPLWMRFQKAGAKSISSTMKPDAPAAPEQAPVAKDTPQPVNPVPDTAVPPGGMEDRAPAPPQKEPNPYASQPEPAATYGSQFVNPPPSPYGAQDKPSVFPDAVPPSAEPYQHVDPEPTLTPLEALEHTVLGGFGANNREMFVEHLFSGSNEAYEDLLTSLTELNSWEEASQLIAGEVFKKNQVNIYSPAAIMFTESIEEQYRQG
ncbi:MAG: hypothetical protein AB8G77_02165 [Rhodothermales bacterium]